MDYFEKTKKVEKKYNGAIINVERMTVELPNKKEAIRDIVRHPGAAFVIPIDSEGNIYLVEQFRKPIDSMLLELPAGKLDKGEKPINCAIRELKEETGIVAENIYEVNKIYTTAGFSDEVIYMYIATGLQMNKSCPDEDEFLNIKKYHIKELITKLDKGEINDSKTIIGILTAKRFLDGEIKF